MPFVVPCVGVIMALAFLVIFPLGASAARTFADMLHGKAVLVHRSAQVVGFVLVIIAMAMGVWVSGQNKTVSPTTFHFSAIGMSYYGFTNPLVLSGHWLPHQLLSREIIRKRPPKLT